jgi:DNA-binding NarL/FixJ family response regulator
VKKRTKELNMTVKILLVDDHPVFRKGLHVLPGDEKDLRIVGEAPWCGRGRARLREESTRINRE